MSPSQARRAARDAQKFAERKAAEELREKEPATLKDIADAARANGIRITRKGRD